MSAPVRLPVLADTEAPARPVTRGDCAGGPRPCPWVSCSHHLALGMLERASGRPVLDDGAVLAALETMPQTCALDVADEGGATLEAVAEPWGVTRERIRQLEARALKRVKPRSLALAPDLSEDELPASVPAPKRVPAARIDWMGDGETETEEPPAAAEEPEVKKVTKRAPSAPRDVSAANGARVTAAAAGARCIANGCVDPPQGYRESLDLALRPLCKKHRLLAQGERSKRQCSAQEAMDIILRRAAASNGCETAPPAQRIFDGPPEVVRDLRTPAGDELASLRDERDAARGEVATIRADRDELALRLRAADDRIDELEGQLLADATSREPSSRPLARLAVLFRALDPASRGALVSVSLLGERPRAELRDLECLGSGEVVHHADGDTPDEALAALVAVVDGIARDRIDALTAALGGAR